MKVFSFIFFLVLPLIDSEASTVSINILTPREAEEISGELLMSAKIEEDNNPFIEEKGLRWVTAIIKDARGVDSIRVSLRDNGKGEDLEQNDGVWTSLAKVKLIEGDYKVFLVVRKGTQTFFSSRIKFRTKPLLFTETKISEIKKEDVLKEVKEVTSNIETNFKNLSNQLYIVGVLVVIFIGIILFITFKRFQKRKMDIAQSVAEPSKPQEEIAPAEKWRPLFSALENMSKEVSQMQKDLSGTFRVHDRYKENFRKAVSNTVWLYENIKDLEEISKDQTNAIKLGLSEALEAVGVEKWEPAIGKPVPEGCEQKPATRDYPSPEGTVVEVLSPGYIIREGERIMPLKKPIVKVAVSKKL